MADKRLRASLFPLLFIAALLGMSTTGCGGARNENPSTKSTTPSATREWTTITSSVIPPGQSLRGDGDVDNPNDIDGNGDRDNTSPGGTDGDNDNPTRASYDFPDMDDKAMFAYGHRPSVATTHAISLVVKAYYRAASEGSGAEACSLLTPSVSRSLAEEYGGSVGPSYLRGARTCQEVLILLFRHFREELTEAITVVDVRRSGNQAQVIFSSRKMPASSIRLKRKGSSWMVSELIGRPLP